MLVGAYVTNENRLWPYVARQAGDAHVARRDRPQARRGELSVENNRGATAVML